jgi:hypothetical protein
VPNNYWVQEVAIAAFRETLCVNYLVQLSCQILTAERFAEKASQTFLPETPESLVLGVPAHKDNRNILVYLPQQQEGLSAIYPRHGQVQHNGGDIVHMLAKHSDAFGSIGGIQDLKASAFDYERD